MSRLNYQHLLYFWQVVREGSVSAACEKLFLAQPTISGQLAVFEQSVGTKLFYKQGKKLVLTETGQIVFRYAEEIFSLGQELNNTLKGRLNGRGLRLTVGVVDAVPKLVVRDLLSPIFNLPESVQLLCYEDKVDRLLTDISLQNLDLILSDTPLTPTIHAKAFNHLLTESSVSVFAAPELAGQYRDNFPRSLAGAPFLLPTSNTALRRSVDQWLDSEGISPSIQAEIEDSALLKTFGSRGLGLFVAPSAVEIEIQRQYNVDVVGKIESIQERFYAITAQRKLKHPAVTAILANAQGK